MRKKPIPNPIARPTAARPLSPASPRAVLPTVAALLAMAAIGCEPQTESIRRDEAVVAMGNTMTHPMVKAPRPHDPSEPLPALGVIEDPPKPPPAPPPPVPTTHPYPVKGGMKAVHPIPTPPMPAGGPKVIHPPIAPIKKPVKLGGDVAPAFPETT